jgi:hypothetical protein
MPAELRRLKRRLDWLETFVSVLDSQLRTQGLRIDLHLEECEPAAHNDRESKIRDAMGPHDARLFHVTRLLREIMARQDDQAAELADLARLLGRLREEHAKGRLHDDRPRGTRRVASRNGRSPG